MGQQNTNSSPFTLDALDQLPEEQALVLFLYYEESFSFGEISRMLGLNPITILLFHNNAIESMKRLLYGAHTKNTGIKEGGGFQ